VGRNRHCTITNCYFKGSVTGTTDTGGLVGYNYYSTITNCYSSVSVSGDKEVGGLIGRNYYDTITNCYSKGTVTGTSEVGGVVGMNQYGTITNCYSRCNVSSNGSVGGLVGSNYYDSKIIFCYSTGSVTGTTEVGGLLGSNFGHVFLCYWDIETSGVSGSDGGEGKTTAEMKSMSTYDGWGYGAAWTIDEGVDYPRLVWENAPGVPIEDPPRHYGGGSGTESKPYLIYTAEHLNTIGRYPADFACHFKLMADIDLSGFGGSEFNIIGYVIGFSGVFDGNGHKISNFSYTSTDKWQIGLFGFVSGENAEIRNLGIIDPNLNAGSGHYAGSLVGRFGNGTITNCYVEGGSVLGEYRVGGLVGWNENGTISKCYATGSVFGSQYVGGLVGHNDNSIVDCYTSGNVTGSDDSYCVGGLCGKSTGPDHGPEQSRIQNCFSRAAVTGNMIVGGLIGHSGAIVTGCYSNGSVTSIGNYSWSIGGLIGNNGGHGIINNCYSSGSVAGDGAMGLVGSNIGSVVASFWDIESSGQTTSEAGTGLTTARMQMASTFICWGYEPVWTIDEGVDYPRLIWENKPGELITVPSDLYGGGSGEADDPFLIYTAEQLNEISFNSCHLDRHFKLMADIDLAGFTGTSFNIIGIDYYSPFSGVFDGNGRKIFNFTYTSTDRNYIGLFGCLSGVVKDLGLIAPNVDAGTGYYVGSMFGRLYYGTVTNCYVEGGSISGDSYVSGLVGYAYHGNISNCYSTADVSGDRRISGLLGYNNYGTITNCYSTGTVSGDTYVGGLVGRNRYGTITNCYAAGSVIGNIYVGGLVGEEYRGTIDDSYSTCIVSGDQHAGGLVGRNRFGTVTKCYSTASVSGDEIVGGFVGEVYKGTITNCYSKGNVSGDEAVGGLVGRNRYGTITNCCSAAGVFGNYYVGGLVADNYSTSTITNCYSSGSVVGISIVGGLVGYNGGTITNCYSTGNVIGNYEIGGLVGRNRDSVTDSFWDIESSGQDLSAGGTGLPTAQMQTINTFTDAGWDFVGVTINGIEDVWFIPQGDYPRLWWEGMQVPMKMTPRKLNCRSYGKWVKAHLILPEGFTVADVDSNRPAVLHSFGFESAPLYIFVNKDKLVEIEAAFEREALCSLSGDWPDELTVAGFLADGNIFLGTSAVRINHPGMKVIEELAMYWLNEDCVQPDWCDQIDTNRDSIVNLLDYALLMNIEVEFVIDE
jgi:hypothetical protein